MTIPQTVLPDFLWKDLIERSLLEDLGTGGDITTQLLLSPKQQLTAKLKARESGILAGMAAAQLAFTLLDPNISFKAFRHDGERVQAGEILASITGSGSAILSGERTALNLLSHLSGIATMTAKFVAEIKGTKGLICCTRKTLPGLRPFQKYAVLMGGGSPHRNRLDDAILIKDNHIAACGSIKEALKRARKHGHLIKVELEVDTILQLEEALQNGGADVYLLDNMPLSRLSEAVKLVNGTAITEASGGITLETVRSIAQSGVDVISIGALTHSVKALDIGLDMP